MESKVLLIDKMNKNILSTLIAFEASVILCFFVCIALFNSSFYYAHKVIFVCIVVSLFWLIFAVLSVKSSGLKLNILYFISLTIFLLAILFIIKTVWFSSYLTLSPEYSFFTGKGHKDTYYHSTLCEAIKNYGYPAVLWRDLSLHQYHCFSHILLAIISKLFRLPCLIAYNYLFPVIFCPLLLFLLIQAIGIIKKWMGNNNSISLLDLFLSLFIVIGFLPIRYSNAISIWWKHTFISESYCVSLILILLYILVIDKIKEEKTIFSSLVTLLFLFLITAAKISSGVIFFIAIAWFFIRTRKIKISTLLIAVLFMGGVIVSLIMFMRDGERGFFKEGISLFHFLKTKVASKYYLTHVFFVFFPALVLFMLSKRFMPYKEYSKTKISIFAEIALLTTFLGYLPGLFINIVTGSAAYFFLPSMFISLLFLVSSGEIQHRFVQSNKEIKLIVLLLLFVVYGESFIRVNSPKYIMKQLIMGKQGSERVVDTPFYKTLNEINILTEGKKKDYCLNVSTDCRIFELYEGWKGYAALSGYLGIPIMPSDGTQHVILLEKDSFSIRD